MCTGSKSNSTPVLPTSSWKYLFFVFPAFPIHQNVNLLLDYIICESSSLASTRDGLKKKKIMF